MENSSLGVSSIHPHMEAHITNKDIQKFSTSSFFFLVHCLLGLHLGSAHIYKLT